MSFELRILDASDVAVDEPWRRRGIATAMIRALQDIAAALSKLLPPYGFTCTVHHLDARIYYAGGLALTTWGLLALLGAAPPLRLT